MHRVIDPLQTSVVNPLFRRAFRIGIPDPGDAVLETTGRRTGKPRRTPVCDGLEGETFWLLAQCGREADWVRNTEADPRVRDSCEAAGRRSAAVGYMPGRADPRPLKLARV